MRLPTQLFGNSLETLESPFLDEEIANRSVAGALDVSRMNGERAIDVSYEHEADAFESPLEHLEPDEEILGGENRVMVGDTLGVPNRWICAIDVVTRNPDYPKKGSPLQIKARGTGVLIGPRYVLTALHVLGTLDANNQLQEVHSLQVSPARNGDNTKSPFGAIKTTSIRVPPERIVRFTVGQGKQTTTVTQRMRDDYALIILPKNIDGLTCRKMRGSLGYWGRDTSIAVVSRLEPRDINGQSGVVTGYPGDTCGTNILTGTKAEKERKIDDCWLRRNDEWASRQWKDVGTMQVPADVRLVHHTADTFKGESGGPICLTRAQTLHLVGIHTDEDTPQRNKGMRVTRRMLEDLVGWINTDAGSTIVEVKNDTLVYKTATTTSPTPPNKEAEDYWQSESVDGEWEDEVAQEVVREEGFDPASVPPDVSAALALAKPDEALAVARAIAAGWHSENELTNLVFFARHKELTPGPLDKKAKNFPQLADEWNNILATKVRLAIQKATRDPVLVVDGTYVSERDREFEGATGKTFKDLVEWAATEVGMNPGLLAAIALAEWDKRALYLGTGEVPSFQSGSDDFFASRATLARNVPAFSKVKFNAKQLFKDINEQQRLVTTVLFKSGKDALLGTAVYAKNGELKVRKGAARNGGDFDTMPIETQFALVRIAMGAGHGGITWNGDFNWVKRSKDEKWINASKGAPGATLLGVAWTLNRVLTGHDIFIRKDEPRRDPSKSGHVTHRNATILVSQALHLSDWVFGKPLPSPVAPLKPQPEAELFGHLIDVSYETEDFDDEQDALEEAAAAYDGASR